MHWVAPCSSYHHCHTFLLNLFMVGASDPILLHTQTHGFKMWAGLTEGYYVFTFSKTKLAIVTIQAIVLN